MLSDKSSPSQAARLRELRVSGWPGRELGQRELARALGVSVPSISAWEHGKTTPPDHRIEAYARLFAVSGTPGRTIQLLTLEELDEQELLAYRELLANLTTLREDTRSPAPAGPQHPWKFPSGEAITIVCSKLDRAHRDRLGDSDPRGPNFIESYRFADLDALLEIVPHVKGLNPASPLKIGVFEELSADDKTAHLILLGGIDYNPFSGKLLEDLKDVPVAQQSPRTTDTDTGAFTVHRVGAPPTRFTPTVKPVKPKSKQRVLEEDVALFVRAPNPYNRKRTLTMCNGMHSRGTHGIVRALTDSKIQERNSRYIEDRFKGTDTYSIVCRVSVVANEIVVPDWTLAEIRLHEWPEAASDTGASSGA